MIISFESIPAACDRRMDGQTCCLCLCHTVSYLTMTESKFSYIINSLIQYHCRDYSKS